MESMLTEAPMSLIPFYFIEANCYLVTTLIIYSHVYAALQSIRNPVGYIFSCPTSTCRIRLMILDKSVRVLISIFVMLGNDKAVAQPTAKELKKCLHLFLYTWITPLNNSSQVAEQRGVNIETLTLPFVQ